MADERLQTLLGGKTIKEHFRRQWTFFAVVEVHSQRLMALTQ